MPGSVKGERSERITRDEEAGDLRPGSTARRFESTCRNSHTRRGIGTAWGCASGFIAGSLHRFVKVLPNRLPVVSGQVADRKYAQPLSFEPVDFFQVLTSKQVTTRLCFQSRGFTPSAG